MDIIILYMTWIEGAVQNNLVPCVGKITSQVIYLHESNVMNLTILMNSFNSLLLGGYYRVLKLTF